MSVAFVLAGLAVTNARADIYAAVCVAAPPPRTDMDIAVMNATNGARLTLPASVNTDADERHPSITTNSTRLAFERRDADAGTTRIIVVDLVTGASADLFTGFEVAQSRPNDPAITPDGTKVATGGPLLLRDGSHYPQLTLTDLQSFPTGPFPHSVIVFESPRVASPLGVRNVAAGGGNLFAFSVPPPRRISPPFQLALARLGLEGSVSFLSSDEADYGQPALAALGRQIVLFPHKGDILFRPAGISTFVGTPTELPRVVNSTQVESQPAITADRRYVAFVRHDSNNHDRLFLWDSQTQLLLNTNGVDLGVIETDLRGGAVSLYTRPPIISGSIFLSGAVTATLTQPSRVGILVQRILGRTRSLGRNAFELENVGRVPLGEFPEGKLRTNWDLAVDGQPLEPGRYLVTLRAIEDDVVRDLGRPRVLHIPKGRVRN